MYEIFFAFLNKILKFSKRYVKSEIKPKTSEIQSIDGVDYSVTVYIHR